MLCICLAVGAALLLPGAAGAASSAQEEYVLTLPGVNTNDATGASAARAAGASAPDRAAWSVSGTAP